MMIWRDGNGANIFMGFNIQNILGTAGLYTGEGEYANGLGLFVDISSVISSDILNDLLQIVKYQLFY